MLEYAGEYKYNLNSLSPRNMYKIQTILRNIKFLKYMMDFMRHEVIKNEHWVTFPCDLEIGSVNSILKH